MNNSGTQDLAARYAAVRSRTQALAAPLSEADCQVQSMPDASPTKWHLAHVTWFFETFVLERHEPGFQPHDPAFRVLFNSYYQGVGEQHPRPQRGLVTRPDLAAVLAYRAAVDARMARLLTRLPAQELPPEARELVALGLQHEQQHQELLLTDALHLLSCNPLAPGYRAEPAADPGVDPGVGTGVGTGVGPGVGTGVDTGVGDEGRPAAPLQWLEQASGLVDIGHAGAGFAFDNEGPRHRHWLVPYALANRLVNQGEWLAFIEDGGYRQPRWWLAAGWDWVRANRVEAPAYWRLQGGRWWTFTLSGLLPLQPDAPVAHISLYEADAYARWASAQLAHPARSSQAGAALRLPTEAEWENAAARLPAAAVAAGNFAESGALRARPADAAAGGLQQMFGDLWEWTGSAYLPYPGYRPWAGAVGEYNGKFMMNQMVLRGGSCATPRDHIRASYRNFFPPEARWQFTGLRLARDA